MKSTILDVCGTEQPPHDRALQSFSLVWTPEVVSGVVEPLLTKAESKLLFKAYGHGMIAPELLVAWERL